MMLIVALAGLVLEPPIAQTMVHIRQEIDGGCSEIEAGRKGARPVLRMTDICHGWSSMGCRELTFFNGHGVIEDQAQILFTRADRTLDLVRILDVAIARKWPGRTHLHLSFGTPDCGSSFVVAFTGSHVDAVKGGPALGMKGRIRVDGPAAYRISQQSGD